MGAIEAILKFSPTLSNRHARRSLWPRGLNSNLLMASISMSTTWWNTAQRSIKFPRGVFAVAILLELLDI